MPYLEGIEGLKALSWIPASTGSNAFVTASLLLLGAAFFSGSLVAPPAMLVSSSTYLEVLKWSVPLALFLKGFSDTARSFIKW